MIQFTFEVTIHRPVKEVFELVIDLENYSRWVPPSGAFVECKLTSTGPVGQGTTYIDTTKTMEMVGEIVAYQPPTRVTFRERAQLLLALFEVRIDYSFEPVPEGTRVTRNYELEAYGPLKLGEPIMASLIRTENEKLLRALKATLEARA